MHPRLAQAWDNMLWRFLQSSPAVIFPVLRAVSLSQYYRLTNKSLKRKIRRDFEALAKMAGITRPLRSIIREHHARSIMFRIAPGLAALHPDPDLGGRLVVEGFEHVETTLAGGRGLVLASAHIGGPGLAAAYLARRGHRVATVRRQELTRITEDSLHQKFAFFGAEPMFIGWDEAPAAPLKRALSVLKDNGVVSYMVDGMYGSRVVPGSLFGRTVEIRTGIAEVARLSRAPIVPAFGLVLRDRLLVRFHPPIRVDAAPDLEPMARAICPLVENVIREHPECINWQSFFRELVRDSAKSGDRITGE